MPGGRTGRRLGRSASSTHNSSDRAVAQQSAAEARSIQQRWHHEIIPLSQDQLDSTELLKNTILSDKSWATYVTFLIKFVCFVVEPHPELLTEDLAGKLNEARDTRLFKGIIKDYLMQKPRPPTSLLKLSGIGTMFENWLNSPSMRKKDGSLFSASTYNTCRSAVVSLFTLFNEPSDEFDAEARRIIRALKVTRAKSAGEGRVSVKRGKDPLSFENYCQIASILIKKSSMRGVFTHTVLTTMWNLMCRIENAVSICKSHIQWDEDALLIFFAHEKTDQTESKPGDPRHIYANPFQPEICPILSLGIYFIITDITATDSQKIFDGENQYGRFHKSLKEMFSDEDLLGHSAGTFGTHSLRKGSATYASSGSTSCPPYSAVCLRAGWTMPGVSSAYLQYQAAGDQYVGRTVSGLNPNSPSFAVLPPRFKSDFDPQPLLNCLFSNFRGVSPEMRKVLSMTTASVLYHFEWIQQQLPPDHPIFSSALFTSNFEGSLHEMVEVPVWKPGNVIRATGIPPHIELMVSMKQVVDSVDALPDKLNTALDQRMQENPGFLGHASANQVKTLIVNTVDEVLKLQRNAMEVEPVAAVPVRVRYPKLYYSEEGKMTRIPPNFTLPKGPLKNCWNRYCCWDETKDIPPLRCVSGRELDRKMSSKFSKYKKVMRLIEVTARKQGVWEEPNNPETAAKILMDVKLDKVFSPVSKNKRRRRRLNQLSWLTLSKEMSSKDYHPPDDSDVDDSVMDVDGDVDEDDPDDDDNRDLDDDDLDDDDDGDDDNDVD